MSKLHIYIDGSWLIKLCAPNGLFQARMQPGNHFVLDFEELKQAVFAHVSSLKPDCTEIGNCYFITSVFSLPPDFTSWAGRVVENSQLTQDQIAKTSRNVIMRQDYVNRALSAGYEQSGIINVPIKEWMIPKLANYKYQEKQVDTTVVALLVRDAITKTEDFFAIIAGDSDILPAINIAYPQFTQKLCLVTMHPDQLSAVHRQTSFSFLQYQYSIEPLFLNTIVEKFASGAYVYRCANCGKVYLAQAPIARFSQPFCLICSRTRT